MENMEMCPTCGEMELGYAARKYGDGETCLTCYYESGPCDLCDNWGCEVCV